MTKARACALAFAAALAVYAGALRAGWTWDDHLHIEGSAFLASPRAGAATLASPYFWLGITPVEGGGRPALLASFLLDRALWKMEPGGWHLSSALLHGACAAAVAAFGAALLGPAAGAAAGLLFGLHPAASEAVCGVAFRGDVLAALFAVLALLARRRAASGAPAWLAAAGTLLLLALLSKENALAWPALALLDEAFAPPEQRAARAGRRRQLAVFLLVLAAYAAFRAPRGSYGALGAAETPQSEPTGDKTLLEPVRPAGPAGPRSAVMSGVLLDYSRLALWPAGLQADRSAPSADWSSARAWGGAAALAALLLAAAALRRRAPAASLGLLWFLAALLPVSGLLPLYNLEAERYLYLPLAGAALAGAAGFEALRRARGSAAWAALALLALPAAAATIARVPAWRDDAALFARAPEAGADSARLRYNRGRLAREHGRLDEAAAEYERALALSPDWREALVNLAEVEGASKRPARELALLRRAEKAYPADGTVLAALGSALGRGGDREGSLAVLRRAVDAEPRMALLRRRLSSALLAVGRPREALDQAETAARLDGSFESLTLAGRIAQELENWDVCTGYMRKAMHLNKSSGLAYANLGMCLHKRGLAANDRDSLENARAVSLEAVRRLPRSLDARRNLGAIYADLGDLERAQEQYAAAVELAPGAAPLWHDYAVVLQRRGRARDAADAYERALARDPAKVESLVNLAGLRASERRFDEAEALLARARAARPGDAVTETAAAAVARAKAAAGAD